MPARLLRLLSVNIQAGARTRGYHDYLARSWSHVLPAGSKRDSLDRIAELAQTHDIVGLQEADAGSLRSGFTNQTHYLAQRAGFPYWSHQPNRRIGNIASSANGLLSRIPPLSLEHHPLPGRIKGRGVLLVRFGHGADGLLVSIAHLSLGAHSRRMQLEFIAELLGQAPHAILMGDFNCTADAPEMRHLFEHTGLLPPQHPLPTFPAWRPQRAIDHVLVTPTLQVVGQQALPAAYSDHLALSMTLQVPAAALQAADQAVAPL